FEVEKRVVPRIGFEPDLTKGTFGFDINFPVPDKKRLGFGIDAEMPIYNVKAPSNVTYGMTGSNDAAAAELLFRNKALYGEDVTEKEAMEAQRAAEERAALATEDQRVASFRKMQKSLTFASPVRGGLYGEDLGDATTAYNERIVNQDGSQDPRPSMSAASSGEVGTTSDSFQLLHDEKHIGQENAVREDDNDVPERSDSITFYRKTADMLSRIRDLTFGSISTSAGNTELAKRPHADPDEEVIVSDVSLPPSSDSGDEIKPQIGEEDEKDALTRKEVAEASKVVRKSL
ncbi:unnamed protein product, partial [Amoebophrya sp. A25]